ncbi:hypothetical protein DM01DRAFT_1335631 [Hesseltinella vesiculosa]|uniref:F-BAR domain-containing protein n=1 Tax=Hesseltinella vesiculosa TaxID=101127 RepID=A0A1X2GIH1_9FUNG|nr:hypothetical protein DM01DRAFT_1335631 [Hesseltinella vesiculosa]
MMDVVNVPKTFANHFWGKEDAGYYALTTKMASAKRTFEDLKAFYGNRAAVHEEMGKKLLKQLKTELGRDETGTLGILLATAQIELEKTAHANLELASKIRTNLEVQLDNFILEQKDKRKLVQTNVDKAHRNKRLYSAHLDKAKEKYEIECSKLVTFEGHLSTAMGRELEKLQQKIHRSKYDVHVFEQEYKSACIKLSEATMVWDCEWKAACDRYQEMEEKRIEFLRHSFSLYVNLLSSNNSHELEAFERFWKSIEQCDRDSDIRTFIDERGTGSLIPDPPVYVHYLDDSSKTFTTFHSAEFPAPHDPATNASLAKLTMTPKGKSMANVSSSPSISTTNTPRTSLHTARTSVHTARSSTNTSRTSFNTSRTSINTTRTVNTQQTKCAPPTSAHATSNNSASSKSTVQDPANPLKTIPRIHKRLPSLHDDGQPASASSRTTSSNSSTPRAATPSHTTPRSASTYDTPRSTPSTTTPSSYDTPQATTPLAKKYSPVLSPTISISSSASRRFLQNQDEDMEIDPRAKVVFTIGNNVFNIDQPHRQSRPPSINRSSPSLRHEVKLSRDDRAFDASIKELLQELGVQPITDNDPTPDNNKTDSSISRQPSTKPASQSPALRPVPQTTKSSTPRSSLSLYPTSPSATIPSSPSSATPQPSATKPTKSTSRPNSIYALTSLPTEPQPSMFAQLQKIYYSGMPPMEQETPLQTQDYQQPIQSSPVQTYSPPTMPKQCILSFARAVHDQPGSDGYLGFKTGDCLAIHSIENGSWCIASIWDRATESLGAIQGYVPRSLIENV